MFKNPVMTISLPKNSPFGNLSATKTSGSVDSSTEIDDTIFPRPLWPANTFACRKEGNLIKSLTVTLTINHLLVVWLYHRKSTLYTTARKSFQTASSRRSRSITTPTTMRNRRKIWRKNRKWNTSSTTDSASAVWPRVVCKNHTTHRADTSSESQNHS